MQLQAEYKAIVGLIARSLQLTPKEVRLMHLRSLSSTAKPPTASDGKTEKHEQPEKGSAKAKDDSSKEKSQLSRRRMAIRAAERQERRPPVLLLLAVPLVSPAKIPTKTATRMTKRCVLY